ncbi:MAG TPA: hypothetical protein VFI22_00040 [Thermomicrobiales bacterium]|nr:hypothetical protein [Thermomicrobiales bacterium]
MAEPDAEPTARGARKRARHELRTALCVVIGREQLLRKRVRRGDSSAQTAADFEAMEAALARLAAAVDRIDDAV